MTRGNKVIFSGNLLREKTHCIDEQSITLNGKLSEPEFTFKFSKIKKIASYNKNFLSNKKMISSRSRSQTEFIEETFKGLSFS